MIRTLTIWELWLVAAFAVVVGRELAGLVVARRQGLTENVSRLVTFSSLLLLACVYGAIGVAWLRATAGSFDELEGLRRVPTANWGYLVLGVMIALVLAYELSALVQARIAGLTRTVSRLLALLIAVLLLLVLLGISQTKWDLYLDRLEATYSDSLQPE